MTALIIADLHLHHLPAWRLEWCESFVSEVCNIYGAPLKAEEGFKSGDFFDLYILGDVLEIRDKVDSRVLNMLLRLFKNWHSGDVVWLSGQHDSYIPGVATLADLRDFKLTNGRIYVVDNDVLYHRKYWFVPFQRSLEDYRRCLDRVPNDSFVLTHMPTKEVIEMYGAKDVDGISIKEFSRFQSAVSGDIHKYYDFDELSYVGAPSQRDWRDKGVEGQIGILSDYVFERIPTVHPKHIEVSSSEEVPEDGTYIVRSKRGVSIDAPNVIDSTETSDIKHDSFELTVGGTVREKLKTYFKASPPPGDITKTLKEAETLLGV